jgi:hypothetical protein
MPSLSTRRRREELALERNADEERGMAPGAPRSRPSAASPYARPVAADGEKTNIFVKLLLDYPGIPIVVFIFVVYHFFIHAK